jgi:amino-acid N-acetyltransferase
MKLLGEVKRTRMTIRKAVPADWQAIEALLGACALPLDGARDHLADFLVYEREGVLGCVGAEVYGTTALLRSLAVAEVARNAGVSGALVMAMISQLKARGVSAIALLTTTAEEYFAARGFEVIERSQMPRALHVSAEMRGACPDSAVAMVLRV